MNLGWEVYALLMMINKRKRRVQIFISILVALLVIDTTHRDVHDQPLASDIILAVKEGMPTQI